MDEEITLRVTLLHPPKGVLFRLRKGRADLVLPAAETGDRVTFELAPRLGRQPDGTPNFLGPFVEGTPTARFVKINSGTLAGQPGSCYTRAVKVQLGSITWDLIDRARAEGGCLAVEIAGTAKDGGPCCATVPLLNGGWRVETNAR